MPEDARGGPAAGGPDGAIDNPERRRLDNQRAGTENWRRWGPYLAERAWGSVREDYSADGNAWSYFPHDHARSRAYRWSEDGLGGICDEGQHLCFALALWNGRDAILKERAFGLTGPEGNHGEDVKEYFFFPDATPSHSYLRFVYKYPQSAFPYDRLVSENARRGRDLPAFNLIDAGAFADRRYWDVEVVYAKASPDEIHMRITATNRGPEEATLHLLPTLWFRNTWSWGDGVAKPVMQGVTPPAGCGWALRAEHPGLGTCYLYDAAPARLLFTENETNVQRLYGTANTTPWVKDAFHRCVVDGDEGAVNPAGAGTKVAGWHPATVVAGGSTQLTLVLSAAPLEQPFAASESIFATRSAECAAFYESLIPAGTPEDKAIVRQAMSGMIWCKEFFHYDVERWLKGDLLPPPASRWSGRNATWRSFKAADVLSMPDIWEYPWFAAWDLAFQMGPLALIDIDFAKDQVELLLSERYMRADGALPAYEWSFDDVNPPVHAMAALKTFRAEEVQRGRGDLDYLRRVYARLERNYQWWKTKEDFDSTHLYEGGFLGLDNIACFNRDAIPPGYHLKEVDATGWMAAFALEMVVIALEIAREDPAYQDQAIAKYDDFLAIANAIEGYHLPKVPLWDEEAGWFKSVMITPDHHYYHVDAFSMVGLIPLVATQVMDAALLDTAPRFRAKLEEHAGGVYQGNKVAATPTHTNAHGEFLLALVGRHRLRRILARVLDEAQFLSSYGIRSLSKYHQTHFDLDDLPGIGNCAIDYEPGEGTTGMFGGNSNWRGAIWFPINYILVSAFENLHRYHGPGFTVPGPDGQAMTLRDVARLISHRLVGIFRRDDKGVRPEFQGQWPFDQEDDWQSLYLFFEYFHGETGQGLGAMHQTGWTGTVANLVLRRYRSERPVPWRQSQPESA